MLKKLFLGAISVMLLYACEPSKNYPIQESVWIPIYGDTTSLRTIKLLDPQPLASSGKIYAYGNYLFQVDVQKGIHVYQIENKMPVKKHFIQLYGAQEISIKNGVLYSNNYSDLVGIDISQLDNVTEVARIRNAFPLGANMTRPPEQGYFQCVDDSKGIVIGWRLEKNKEANCKY